MKCEINVKDLAIYLIDKKEIKNPLLLQKILFLIRFEELKNKENFKVFTGKEIFQAWINGPVIKEIYDQFRMYFYGQDEYDEFKINNKEKINVLKKYDSYIEKYMNIYDSNGIWFLVNLTQENIAWINARKGLEVNKPSTKHLNNDEIPQMTNEFYKMIREIMK